MINRPAYLSQLEPFVGKNIIKVLVGVRRSGKSTLLKLVQRELEHRGIPLDDMLAIDLESSRFADITTADDLIAFVSERISPDRKQYLFFDEIQEVEGWEKALRSFMVDYDVDLYVTGSNSRLLSSDLATYITGRYVSIPVYPFSFAEWCEARSEIDGQIAPLDTRAAFSDYVEQGGFPFQVELDFARRPTLQYVQDVFSTILLKDVVQKNEFRDADQLDRIVRYAIAEVGHSFSAKSVSDYLKAERRSVSLETIYSYLRGAEEACLLYRVGREDAIGKRALKFNEKYYVVDQGIRQALGMDNRGSIDQVLENIVFVELLRRGYDVKVGKVGDREVDFVAYGERGPEYYQVAYLVPDAHVEDREFGSLRDIKDNYPKCVLSLDEFPRSRDGIVGVNLIDWLLGAPTPRA